MTLPHLNAAEIFYPESDGKPMAETDIHRDLMVDLIESAKQHFRAAPDVYVSGNLFLYYREGHPRENVSPDVLVTRGIPRGRRRVYKVWVEGKPPDVVVELTSDSTRLEDLGNKRAIYEQMGVQEYFIFDPETERAERRFRGFRLRGETYEPLRPVLSPAGEEVFQCKVLGLELHGSTGSLRWFDPTTGTPLLVPADALARATEEERRARQAHERAEHEHQRAEHEHQRAEHECERAEHERERAAREHERAERERLRAEVAEQELARLRDEIAKLQGSGPG